MQKSETMFLITRIDSLKDRHILVVCYMFLAAPQLLWRVRKEEGPWGTQVLTGGGER